MVFSRLRILTLLVAAIGFTGCSDGPTGPTAGNLSITVTGLAAGLNAAVTVTGPDGTSRVVTSTQTLSDLPPGVYTVTAADIPVSGGSFVATARSQSITVEAGATASATIVYEARTSFNISIDGMYLTQSVQRYDGSVPLVANRDGYLRVFAVANELNDAPPPVRVRLYHGAELRSTLLIQPSSPIVPLVVNEGNLSGSWNVMIPGALIQPGLSILADIDPEGRILESNKTDNQFPNSGTPRPMDVRVAAPFRIRLVPVQQPNGTIGDVSGLNKDGLMEFTQKVYPLPGYDADTRAPYVTGQQTAGGSAGSAAWSQILSEIEALRVAEANDGRYYYGVLKINYTSGVLGIGYVPGRSAAGYDALPGAAETLAHEVGHNWGRQHTPCTPPGNPPANPDQNFPYKDGSIGVFGLDIATTTLKPPTFTDLMGYCASKWISDYTYTQVLAYRAATPLISTSVGTTEQPSLLVWGRISRDGIELEPAFEVTTRPTLPSTRGPYTLEGLDANGAAVFSISFAGNQVTHAPEGTSQFAFAVPVTEDQKARLVSLRLRGNGHQAVITAAGSPESTVQSARAGGVRQNPALQRVGANKLSLRWNKATHPMVMVRDAQTGQILSFARNGDVTLGVEPGRQLDLVFSDRIRSQRQRITVDR